MIDLLNDQLDERLIDIISHKISKIEKASPKWREHANRIAFLLDEGMNLMKQYPDNEILEDNVSILAALSVGLELGCLL